MGRVTVRPGRGWAGRPERPSLYPIHRHLPFEPDRNFPRSHRPAPERARPPEGPVGIEPGVRIGGFLLGKEIGRGMTGLVFEARQTASDRLAAVKVLWPHLGESAAAIARFREEAALAGRVPQPGVLPLIASGRNAGHEYYATALATGPTLAQFIDEAVGTRGEMFFRESALHFARVARTVEALHRAGIVHRKIKPSNLFMEGDSFLLADFELAIDLQRSVDTPERPEDSFPGAGIRRPRVYAAPEEFVSGSWLNSRVDVYSLGLSLYELAVGVLPFPCCKDDELARLKMTREPIAPAQLNGDVPLGLQAVIQQAIASCPASRHPTAADLAHDLERFAEGKRGDTRHHETPGRDPSDDEGGDESPDLARIA